MDTTEYAFPLAGLQQGLTKRQYFAAAAMNALIVRGAFWKQNGDGDDFEMLTHIAWEIADAMLASELP